MTVVRGQTRRRARIAALATLVFLMFGGGTVHAGGTSDKTADEIVDRMIDTDPLGYGGAEARIVMALVNRRGQVRKRKVVMFSRKDGSLRRLFLRFLSPADIAGTAFLGIDNKGDRTQHLYMPNLAKTRRISSTQRNASFVGTDYSYADLDNRDIDDAAKRRLDDVVVGGQSTFVIDATPTDEKSKYGRVRLWISKRSYLPLRIRFFDKHGNEIKRLTVKAVKKVRKRWIISESKMVDLKREHTTIFKVVEIELREDIDLSQFTVRALERG